MPEELTVRDAALLLGVYPETVRRRIRKGRLPATLRGGRKEGYRIAIADLKPLFGKLAEKERQREEAMLQQGVPIPCEFVESAAPLRIDGGESLPYPPLPGGPFASNEELFDYVDTCANLANVALKELRDRLNNQKEKKGEKDDQG